MSILETKELLGKRVSLNIDYGVAGYAPKCLTGLIVGFVTPLAGYEDIVGNEALFLEDGKDEPYYISSDDVQFNLELL
jgi:hypothetical protein